MKTYIGVLLAAIVMLPTAAAAQDNRTFVEARGSVKPVPLPPGGPTPRMSDGHPDFSGVWFDGPTGRANAWSVDREQGPPEDPIPFQPWAQAKWDATSRLERELNSPSVNCMPVGTPGMFMENAFAHHIIMKPGQFVHLVEMNNRWHVIHTDGRPHKPTEEQEPLFYGDQTARWEGDTLVIDSISIDERTQIRDGWFHSDQLHVIERLRRPSLNYLDIPGHDRRPESTDQAVDIALEHAHAFGAQRRSDRELLHQQRERRTTQEAVRDPEASVVRRERSALEALHRVASSGVPRQWACATTPRDAIRSERRRHD